MDKEDLYLWEIAKARVTFRPHLIIYLVVNILFWIIWFNTEFYMESSIPWPIYPLVGWGIGLFFHYSIAYRKFGGSAMKKEFEKVKKSKKASS